MRPKSDGLYRRLTRHDDPNSLSSYFRERRIGHLKSLIQELYDTSGRVSILDIGGAEHYWKSLSGYLEERNVTITVLNLTRGRSDRGIFTHVEGNGCNLPFGDFSFDIAHSNSVIEHVGGWCDMKAFASETKRVAFAYFVQTPAFAFPIEPHFGLPAFHWLPRAARTQLVQRMACGHFEKCQSQSEAEAVVDSAKLLTKRQMETLFPNAQILPERLFGLTKSFMAIRNPQFGRSIQTYVIRAH